MPRIEHDFIAEADFRTGARETFAFRVTNGAFFCWLEQASGQADIPPRQRDAVNAGKLALAVEGMRESLGGLCESRGCKVSDIRTGRILLEKTLDNGKLIWRMRPTYDFPNGGSVTMQSTFGEEVSVPVNKDWFKQVLWVRSPSNVSASGSRILDITYQGKDANAKEPVAVLKFRPLLFENEE